jgi:hypothetical protein
MRRAFPPARTTAVTWSRIGLAGDGNLPPSCDFTVFDYRLSRVTLRHFDAMRRFMGVFPGLTVFPQR